MDAGDQLFTVGILLLVVIHFLLIAKFMKTWKEEETAHWKRWGSPDLMTGGAMLAWMVYGQEFLKLENRQLRLLRNFLLVFYTSLTLLVTVFFGILLINAIF